MQRKMLIDKRKQLDSMIKTIEKTIQHGKGEYSMTMKRNLQALTLVKTPMNKKQKNAGVTRRLISPIKK